MNTQTYTYLKFVHFCNVQEWDVKRYNQQKLHFKSGILLNEILFPYKQNIERKEIISKKLQIIQKINFSGALFLRNFEEIKTYKGNLNIVPPNSLIYSKINIRHGCIYYNAIENKPFCVSSEYPVYTFDNKKVNGLFLKYLLQSNKFKELLNTKTSGISKARVKESEFLRIEIPFLPLSEQNALVTAYNAKMLQAATLETQAAETEANIENYLFEMLGIKKAKTKKHNNKDGFLQMISFKDLNVWGVEQNLNDNNNFLHSYIYKNDALGDILSINPKTDISTLNEDDEMSFIPMECISDKYGEWIADNKLIGIKLKSKGYTKFQNGDLIWARITPCMQNGKSAIVDNLQNGFGYGSTEFHVIRNFREDINLKYIHLLLRCQFVLKKAMSHFTGSAGQQRVPKSFLENLKIPLPPLSIQNEIVTNISAQKEIIKAKKLQAEDLRKEALIEFEKAIFE